MPDGIKSFFKVNKASKDFGFVLVYVFINDSVEGINVVRCSVFGQKSNLTFLQDFVGFKKVL